VSCAAQNQAVSAISDFVVLSFQVSRITSKAAEYDDLQLRIDINTEIYPMLPSDKFLFCLAHSLSAEGMDRKEVWRDVGTGKRTLADEYEYVVHGKVYRYTDKEDGSM
jgi:DNA-directed RNA polymerase I, II, and III subunit RPABC3